MDDRENDKAQGRTRSIAVPAKETGLTATAAGIGLAIGGPAGAVAGAALPSAAHLAWNAMMAIRGRRAQRMLEAAAAESRLPLEALIERLSERTSGEQLLVKAAQAALEIDDGETLVALAHAVASSVTANDRERFRLGKLVDALGIVKAPHIEVLRCFARTANDLGLGNGGPEFDRPPDTLNLTQLELALPGAEDLLPIVLPELEALGLLATSMPSAGALRASGATAWSITKQGSLLLGLLGEVSAQR